jgi:hypothetical protein
MGFSRDLPTRSKRSIFLPRISILNASFQSTTDIPGVSLHDASTLERVQVMSSISSGRDVIRWAMHQ